MKINLYNSWYNLQKQRKNKNCLPLAGPCITPILFVWLIKFMLFKRSQNLISHYLLVILWGQCQHSLMTFYHFQTQYSSSYRLCNLSWTNISGSNSWCGHFVDKCLNLNFFRDLSPVVLFVHKLLILFFQVRCTVKPEKM